MVVQYHRTRVQHTPQFHIITIPRTIRYQLHLIMPHRVSPTDQGTPVLHHMPPYGSTPSNANRSSGNHIPGRRIYVDQLDAAYEAHFGHHDQHDHGVAQSNAHTGVNRAPLRSQPQPLATGSNSALQASGHEQARLRIEMSARLTEIERIENIVRARAAEAAEAAREEENRSSRPQ